MNAGKYTLIVLACVAVIAVAAVCVIGESGLGFITAVVIEPKHGLVILDGTSSAVTVGGKVDFEKYLYGDRLLIVHGEILDSSPGQTRGHFALRIGRGGTVDEYLMRSLREMGWIE